MKKFFLILFFIFLLTACSSKQFVNENKKDKLTVAVSIFPVFDIVRQVGGDKIDSLLIVSPGASPHTFEVTPSEIKKMQEVDIFFSVGAGLDFWIDNITNSFKEAKSISFSDYIDLRHFENDIDDEHGEFDPHYWLSPDNAKIIARQSALLLGEIDIVNKDYYKEKADEFIFELDEKDKKWQEKINNLPNKDIVVFHDAWGYFAQYYKLNVVATFEPFPGKTPSPQYLIDLQNDIKKYNVKSLFIEPQLSKEALSTVAQDLDLEIKVLDPLGGVQGRNSYLELMDFNINNL